MFQDKKLLGLITARGGSKGVPNKNIRNVAGQPLIAWTIKAAQASRYIDRLVLSSDSHEIIQVARAYSCDVPFVRPAHLATDEAPGIDPVLHALEQVPGYDYVVLLQPTSPLRTADDIDGCISACICAQAARCVSVVKAKHPPFWSFRMTNGSMLVPLMGDATTPTRRQEAPDVYELNGAVYVASSEELKRTRSFLTPQALGYVMPPERSVDVDTLLDLQFVDFLLSRPDA